ncbi:hypothetical protein GCM10028820_32750 [Tessaracoccus terricola]
MNPRTRPMRKLLTLALSLATALALALSGPGANHPASADESPDVLNPSAMPLGVITSDVQVGRYTIRATEAAAVEVDAQERTGGEYVFTQRLKLNGGGTAERRSVAFTTFGPAVLNAYALSASASADRQLALYAEDGALVEALPAYGAPTDIPLARFTVPEAGAYYVASPSSGVNIFHLELVDGEAPERPAWDTVAAPVLTDARQEGRDIVVQFDGVVGFDGADLATATLYRDDDVVATGISGAQASSGEIRLTPSASGNYTVEVALQRTDEDEALLSDRLEVPGFILPLGTSEVVSVLTSAVEAAVATITVEWAAVPEADGYVVEFRESGSTEWAALTETTATSAEIPGLAPGTTVELRVVTSRGAESTISEIHSADVSDVVERWLEAHAGVSSNGTLVHAEDGSMTFDMRGNNGKIADSEDGFYYYYTEIDPATENWTLSATFTVDDASGKDNQSGFGIIAVDTFEPGNRDARYFNNVGTMSAKYVRDLGDSLDTRYGTPGSKVVTGYTEGPRVATPARDMTGSQPFDWAYRDGMTEGVNVNPPRFVDGDVYEYTLRKSNTGFHSIWSVDGEEHEVITYEPDLLLQQTADSYYVGVFTARNIVVTVSDLTFTTIHPDDDEAPLERPVTYVDPWLTADVTRTTPHDALGIPLLSNIHGTATVTDAEGETLGGPVEVVPGNLATVEVPLADGTNDYTATIVPAPRAEQGGLGEYEDLSSYEPLSIPVTITRHSYGEPGQAIHVSPDGSPEGDGTPAEPLDLHTAVAYAQPGQQVVLAAGTYRPAKRISIERGNDGTAEQSIVLMSEPGERAVLDLSESPTGGIHLRGDHWHLYNLEITGSRGYQKPLLISGNHNVVERIESHHNADTGIQISGSASEPPSMWPSHNLVVSSVSHNNADPLANDADGFAAKITSGEGNVFRYSIAHNNIDDGWDLYAKSTEGPIGDVVVEHSVAYRNGWLEEAPDVLGEGNGFKLGGENMPGAHLLSNSVSFDNAGAGVTSNSGPDVRVLDVTSYGNAGPNLRLYTSADQTAYEVRGLLSAEGGAADSLGLRGQDDDISTDPTNVLDGVTLAGDPVTDEWFESVDLGVAPRIADDGSIDMQGLLELVDPEAGAWGARLAAHPDPTVLELLPPVEPVAVPSPEPTEEPSEEPTEEPTEPEPGDLYETPGFHTVNGRQWMTVCEPYSVTTRCFTYIWGTTIGTWNGEFYQHNGWNFNNLTYLGSPRSAWADNPLGYTGLWTADDGRQWRTECDTPAVGGNGCRSYVTAKVIERDGNSYKVVTKEVFNNIVRFS